MGCTALSHSLGSPLNLTVLEEPSDDSPVTGTALSGEALRDRFFLDFDGCIAYSLSRMSVCTLSSPIGFLSRK